MVTVFTINSPTLNYSYVWFLKRKTDIVALFLQKKKQSAHAFILLPLEKHSMYTLCYLNFLSTQNRSSDINSEQRGDRLLRYLKTISITGRWLPTTISPKSDYGVANKEHELPKSRQIYVITVVEEPKYSSIT